MDTKTTLLILNILLDCFIFGLVIIKKYYSGKNIYPVLETKTGLIFHMKEAIKMNRLENYRGITVVYLEEPNRTDPLGAKLLSYHFFWKGEIEFGSSFFDGALTDQENFDNLRNMAVKKIDNLV